MGILNEVVAWAREHVGLLAIGAAASALSLAAIAAAAWWYFITIPADHFAEGRKRLEVLRGYHPALRWSVLIGKNLLGAVLLLAGMFMIVAPGPGWLAVILGLSFVDFPGKRTIERKIVRHPAILRIVNPLRARAGKPPLVFTPQCDQDAS